MSEVRQNIDKQMRMALFLIQRYYNDKDVYSYKAIIRHFESKLISEIVRDLTLSHPMIGFKYTREELIKKWEEKLK